MQFSDKYFYRRLYVTCIYFKKRSEIPTKNTLAEKVAAKTRKMFCDLGHNFNVINSIPAWALAAFLILHLFHHSLCQVLDTTFL